MPSPTSIEEARDVLKKLQDILAAVKDAKRKTSHTPTKNALSAFHDVLKDSLKEYEVGLRDWEKGMVGVRLALNVTKTFEEFADLLQERGLVDVSRKLLTV